MTDNQYLFMNTILIIGGGNMGTALLERVRKHFKVLVCEQNPQRAGYLRRKYKIVLADLATAVKKSHIVILAVKPQDIDEVLENLRPFADKKLMISIAAGITISYLEKKLGGGVRVIRTMPNMPAQIGEGITAIAAGKFTKSTDVKLTQKIFNLVGKTIIVEENVLDCVTAVSGSGPAYVFLFVECFIKAAQTLGLDAAQSKVLVYQTLLGSAHLLKQSKDSAAELRAKVTSKGGTTQAAIDVLTAYNIEKAFIDAFAAAKRRAGELAK